ncbi:hypothetical protein F441_22741 [Phytophthora nicotianae CJ01A1]|uniref:Uncharacterized protein n=1 Tax=Phytophthora nicotianae CJ01A1 TaxID=1317063 RepID=W2VNT0_PHYNI|nr:hypothetical protein F441_22741 [Phytophthora nicotianae CJ01A1]
MRARLPRGVLQRVSLQRGLPNKCTTPTRCARSYCACSNWGSCSIHRETS